MRTEILDSSAWCRKKFGGALAVEVFQSAGNHVVEGVIRSPDGRLFPITRGVPCFVEGDLRPDFSAFEREHGIRCSSDSVERKSVEGHGATVETFSDKWSRFRNYGLDPKHEEFLFEWYCRKFGVADLEALKSFYREHTDVLEVGPGSGFNARFMSQFVQGAVYAADISEAAYTAYENTRHLDNCHVVQADLMDLPFADESFDLIVADGVLHHTPDTQKSVIALYEKLRPGGRFFFYVYKQMGPARQFCDRYIGERFSQLTPEECYQACEGLTELGRELGKLNAKVRLSKGVEVLGIPAGEHDVQRLLYYNFVKCFWNDAFDFETNNMVNFDWYHPVFAWQHTENSVASWLDELGVEEYQFNPANPNGLSVMLRKPCRSRAAA